MNSFRSEAALPQVGSLRKATLVIVACIEPVSSAMYLPTGHNFSSIKHLNVHLKVNSARVA
jgi:hypothetical protein